MKYPFESDYVGSWQEKVDWEHAGTSISDEDKQPEQLQIILTK